MRKLLDIRRQSALPDARPYHQVFAFEADDETATVATALRELNARTHLADVDGRPSEPIRWECSCLQRKCGACAMVINGRPQLACDAKLASFAGDTIRLEPLSKFPVVADLVVDRSPIFERLRNLQIWLNEEVELPTRRNALAYESSRCLQCGCCLEVCPNFSVESMFGGISVMVPLSRLIAETKGPDKRALLKTYRSAIVAGCGKSLACQSICPAGIDIAGLMSRSNAAALWHR